MDFDDEKKTHATVVENDEHDHRDYARPKEFDRMNWIAQSDWHKAHTHNKLIIYRFNPHGYTVDQQRGTLTYAKAVAWMSNHIKTYVPEREVEIWYIRYPARTHPHGVFPLVLDEPEFPDNLKSGVRCVY